MSRRITLLVPAALLGLFALPSTGLGLATQEAAVETRETSIPWNRRTVEHLFNRAGFGVRAGAAAKALRRTPEEVVEELLAGKKAVEPPYYEQGITVEMAAQRATDRSDKRRARALWSRDDRAQLLDYSSWWVDRMVQHDDPLRDRMSLFWHGLFATNYQTVKRSYDLIEQHHLIRENALGNYSDLLHGIVKDPAMIAFLDNEKNRKGAPNENLARELMELFSLGEGHYTEDDVKEVARALTGESRDRLGNYVYTARYHDGGRKTILGETDRFDADGVVDLILRQTACSRYIAGRIITYLEGVAPDEVRLAEYAAWLKRHDYEIEPFLRKLLLDPRFYREDVLAARVMSPLDYYVGLTRRLSMKVDSKVLIAAAAQLDQRLFDPPSVKGWDEGEAWITTGSLLQRGNTTGLLLGTIDVRATFQLKPERDPFEVDSERRRATAEPQRRGREVAGDDSMGDDSANEGGMGDDSMDDGGMGDDSMGGMDDDSMDDGGMSMGDSVMSREPRANDAKDDLPKEIRDVLREMGSTYRPQVNLNYRLRGMKSQTDAKIVSALLEELLAIPVPEDTRARVLSHFRAERERVGLTEEGLLENPELAEPLLRRLAHLILSLPEAQLS